MAEYQYRTRNDYSGGGTPKLFIFIVAVLALLFAARSIAQLVIEYSWWSELGQIRTWQSIIIYSVVPVVLGTLLAFAVLWIVHARALKFAGTSMREQPLYAKISTLALLLVSFLIARVSLDSWTTVLFYGSQRGAAGAENWRDPIFNNTLSFYMFELPFYAQLLGLVLGVTVVGALIFYFGARAWQIARQARRWRDETMVEFQPSDLLLSGAFESVMLRTLVAIGLLVLAARALLARYEFLHEDHGFLVGVDFLAHNVTLPLQYLSVAAFVVAAVMMLIGRWKFALVAVAVVVLKGIVPPLVSMAYVKPNEITLQRPYLEHHIAGTRAAYGFETQLKEVTYPAQLEAPIDVKKHAPLLENVRLWDWRAFHDTVTQIQALRPYYVFPDTDVDRYIIDGRLRQVMLTPRELDIRQLPEARANWINTHFIYTHGYGLVMAEANRITENGQPVLFVQDAPARVHTASLQLTRPEIYFGEVVHEPVFVATAQPEFSYPSGSDNVQTKYEGTGGISIGTFPMRLAASLALADRNLLLTGFLTNESRMLIHRNVRNRVNKLASFIDWDPDPYLVLQEDGRLMWVIDGYTTSNNHPYSRRLRLGQIGALNYMRNSVKATIDAYNGSVRMYVFAPQDPMIRSFAAIFPDLFQPSSEMPSELRRHTRYPELLFRTQAEIYRTYHMLDPEAFYNREDLWDLARNVYAQATQPEPVPPTFVVATLPGETEPEFLLVQPFTPRNKDNLIGLMVARSDGEHLGELVVLQLSKQSLIYGPMQVEARIDADSEIVKDLSLWNQQGSQVLRGHILVLPINETFLYVEPIYIQSAQARMPQLRKVVLAMGNRLIYRDTYDEALAALTGMELERGDPVRSAAPQPTPPEEGQLTAVAAAPAPPPPRPADGRIENVRNHLRRYREFSSQGRWSEAGRELEALERLVTQ